MSAPNAKTHMVRRMGVALAVCAAVPVVLFAVLAAYFVATSASESLEQRHARTSSLYSVILRSKLSAAETLVQTLTDSDVGFDGSSLKQDVANSRAFKSVVVVDRDGLLAGGETTLRPSPGAVAGAGDRSDRGHAGHARPASSPRFSWRGR